RARGSMRETHGRGGDSGTFGPPTRLRSLSSQVSSHGEPLRRVARAFLDRASRETQDGRGDCKMDGAKEARREPPPGPARFARTGNPGGRQPMTRFLKPLLVAAAVASLAACSSGTTSPNHGNLAVLLTDAPIDLTGVKAVNVTLTDMIVYSSETASDTGDS